MKRFFLICALLAALLLALCACGDEPDVSFAENGVPDLVVVRPAGGDQAESDAAARLFTFLNNLYDKAEINMITDRKSDDGEHTEILVGATSREATSAVMSKLRYGEYAITSSGGKIVIAGGSPEATSDAINYFIENYTKVLDSGVFRHSDSYFITLDYAVGEAKIGGRDLRDYVIVYPAGDDRYGGAGVYSYQAQLLRDYFIDLSGIPLEIVTDEEPETDHEILIGNTSRSGDYPSDLRFYEWQISCGGGKLNVAPGGLWAAYETLSCLDEYASDGKFSFPRGEERVSEGGVEAREEQFVYITSDGVSGETPVKKMTIGGTNLDRFTIVCHDYGETYEGYAGVSETYAAKQLSKYLKYATGVELPVVYDNNVPKADGAHEIIVGATDRGCPEDVSGLGTEGFVIAAEGGDLYIAGGEIRGALYGVYEFLEEYVGCRFFASDCEVIYRSQLVEIPEGLRDEQQSDMIYRDVYSHDALKGDIASKLKINGYYQRAFRREEGGSEMFAGGDNGFVHTITRMLYVGNSLDNQPCMSDPENLEKAKIHVRGMLNAYPGTRIISVSQNDNNNYCKCASCASINREEGSNAGTLIRFVNALADDIAEDYPDVKILTLAYMYSVKAPKTPPRDNVIIELCAYDFCTAHPYGECQSNVGFKDELENWHSMTDNLFVWDYVVNFAKDYQDAPFMNFDPIYENFKTYRENGVIGLFNEGYSGAYGKEFGELRTYLLAHLMWDPDITREQYDKMIREFIDAFYGSRSDAVQRYFDFLSGISGRSHFNLYSNPSSIIDADSFTAAKKELAQWFNAASKLRADEPDSVTVHTDRLKEGFDYIYRYFD